MERVVHSDSFAYGVCLLNKSIANTDTLFDLFNFRDLNFADFLGATHVSSSTGTSKESIKAYDADRLILAEVGRRRAEQFCRFIKAYDLNA